MKLLTIMWSSFIPILRDAAEVTAIFNLKAYSSKQLNLDPQCRWGCRKGNKDRRSDIALSHGGTVLG